MHHLRTFLFAISSHGVFSFNPFAVKQVWKKPHQVEIQPKFQLSIDPKTFSLANHLSSNLAKLPSMVKSLEVQDQTKWLVFRMIHVKDSRSYHGAKFGLWTSWEIVGIIWHHWSFACHLTSRMVHHLSNQRSTANHHEFSSVNLLASLKSRSLHQGPSRPLNSNSFWEKVPWHFEVGIYFINNSRVDYIFSFNGLSMTSRVHGFLFFPVGALCRVLMLL